MKKMKYLSKIAGFITGISFLAIPYIVLADAASDAQAKELVTYVQSWYWNLLLPIGTVLAGFVIMYAGITYAMSEGEPSKVSVAKEYLVGAISGLALLLTAAMIIKTVIK